MPDYDSSAHDPYDTSAHDPYDALLYVSFGGPEAPDEVMPFLEQVVTGRNVPRERLLDVAEHYHHHGGRSPINDQNRAMIAALETDFLANGIDLPIVFGNRNSAPWLTDAMRELADAGHRRILAYVTSAYSSYSGCRQYREDLARAADEAGVDLQIDKVRVFYNHPGFVAAQADRVRGALTDLPGTIDRARTRLVFVSHSVPLSMARHSDYEAQHLDASRLVARAVDPTIGWDLVWCSRSGPPSVPWLDPDIGDHLRTLAASGDVEAVVVVPIGFVSDHMEVIHDLDVEAAEIADEVGLDFARAGTVGTHPTFVATVRSLVLERHADRVPEAVGLRGANHDACPVDCCRVPGAPERDVVASAPPRTRPAA